MDKSIEFEQVILQHKNINAAYVEFPFSTETLFGKKGQVKVKVIFDNKVLYRGSLAKMGGNCHILGLTQAIRNQLGKTFGDVVHITLSQDTEERIVEVPADVSKLLNEKPTLLERFNKTSYTCQKEYIQAINQAKKIETREKRIKLLIDFLENKK